MTGLERREKSVTTAPRSRPRRRKGFTYAEMLVTTLLLALSTSVLCSAVNVCARQARIRSDDAQAVLLLNAVRDAVRVDLTHATRYRESDGAFQSASRNPPDAWTRYDDWTAFPMIPPEMYVGADAEETLSAEVRLTLTSDGSLFVATVGVYGGERELLAHDSFSVIPLGAAEIVP